MLEGNKTILCDGCGVEITWAPLTRRAQRGTTVYHYCCNECWKGLQCTCGERMELDAERKPGGAPTAWPQ